MTNEEQEQLDQAIAQMQVAAFNFSGRFIVDGPVRRSYIAQVQATAREYNALVAAGKMSPLEAAKEAQLLRNEILMQHRAISTEFGRAVAEKIKPEGTYEEIAAKAENIIREYVEN